MQLPSSNQAGEALQSTGFIKLQYFMLSWTTGMLDFPPHVSNHQVPNPTSTNQPPKSPKVPFPGLDTLLGTWQVQGSSLKKKKEQSSSIPLSATAPKCSQQTPRAAAGNRSLNYKAAFVLWHANWWDPRNRMLLTLANARKGSAELTLLIIPLRGESFCY